MSELQVISKYIKNNNNSINTLLGDIIDLKQIGQGGNGLVYEGTLHGKIVAIKFLVSNDRQKLVRFKAEYFNINTLQPNKHIVKYINFEELKIEDYVFPMIIMNKYDCSLKKYRQNIETPSWDNFILFFNFLIKSIKYIHAHGIIHRDLKPENILVLEEFPSFVLADFGIANYSEEYLLKAITTAGERIGNYEFSAPEQASRNVPSCKTMDIYALGQLCQWFTFGSTHKGTGRNFLTSIFNDELTFLYDEIINKCIQNNPQDRFQTISELEGFLSNQITNFRNKHIDPFNELFIFNKTLKSSFPESYGTPIFSSDMNRIEILIKNIKAQNSKSCLQFNTGVYNNEILELDFFKSSDKSHYILLINQDEFALNGVWVYSGDSAYNDLLIFDVDTLDEFIVDGEKVRSYAIANEQHIIKSTYADSGYFLLDNTPHEIISCKYRNRPIVNKLSHNRYYFIGYRWNNYIFSRNDSALSKVQSLDLNLNLIKQLDRDTFFNKHPDIYMYL
ncbi:protein kinase [Cetobacterium sp.]|uniref:protein kinase domain-containing protein n=1 Tax=Cetobacterium sp. TaxID=2071632 RepID=UPI0025B7BD0A|nr:protein kinase [Cetobacterium sp.]